jgi:hypothetical protein
LASVVVAGCVIVVSAAETARVTARPLMGLSFPSRTVTVIVLVPVAAVIVASEAETVERVAETAPGVTVTLGAAVVTEFPLITAWTWLAVPATTPVRVPV